MPGVGVGTPLVIFRFKGYDFSVVLVLNMVLILTILVINWVWF